MSNRQARREQSRAARNQRAVRSGGRAPRRPAPGGGGGSSGMGWLTQPFTLIAAGLAIILVIALVVAVVMFGGNDEGSDAVSGLEEARAKLPLDMAKGNKLGSDDAPVKMTQFEDFQCPFCLRYTALQEPTLVEEFVKTGKVQIIYEHFPGLGRESVWAAGASFCAADQNKFWEYHNLLFHVQAKAGQLEDEEVNVGRFDLPKLKEFGKQVGIPDQGTFEQCIDSGKHDEDVANQQRRARSLGITGTPGFLINGRPLTTGALANIEDWREVLNDAVNQAQNPSPSPTAAGVTVTSSTPAPAVTPTPTRAP